MAENQYVNKVVYDGNTLIDLTADTITAADVINNKTFHLKSGAPATGTCTYDADTSDATANASDILLGSTAYVSGAKVTGTMPNNGSTTLAIDDVTDQIPIPSGYHDGGGKAVIDATEAAKIIPSNIREDITILGVTGTMSGTEGVTAETVVMTPTTQTQTRTPSSGYNYISQVTVNAIPYTETDNAVGGKTITIA